MTTLPSRWRSAGLALLPALLVAAGCGSSGGTKTEVTVTGLSVSPRPTSVEVAGTRQLTATATYSDGSTGAVTNDAAWVSSITAVATVSNHGLVTGVAPGTSRVTATFGGRSAYSDVTVTAAAPTLVSIAITPDPATVGSGATLQLTVTGTYTSGPTQNVTTDATFVSSVTAVATVTSGPSTGGLVTGVSEGTATITATVGTVSARREVTVTAATPPPPANQIVFWDGAYGTSVQFRDFGGAANNVVLDSAERFQGRRVIQFDVTGTGGYSGGAWVTSQPRDLSAYDALTFYAKASAPQSLNVTGFGDEAGASFGTEYKTERAALPLTTSWQKFVIPIPDPARFVNVAGLFHLADAPDGYTLFLADVIYEQLGAGALGAAAATIDADNLHTVTLAQGASTTLSPARNRVVYSAVTLDPANPVTLTPVSNRFFAFTSADPNVATVDATGLVTGVTGGGPIAITATLAGAAASGSYGVVVTSSLPVLAAPPPVPPEPVTSVISFYSSVTGGYDGTAADYGSHIDTWRTCWSPAGATGGDPIATPVSSGGVSASPRKYVLGTAGDSYVGIELLGKTGATQPGSCNGTVTGANELDARGMDHLHIDIWTPDVDLASNFQIKLVDAGADLVPNNADDSWAIYQVNATSLTREAWNSLDFALSTPVAGALTNRAHIGQIVLQSPGGGTFYIDNFYLYSMGTPPLATPGTLPPAPAQPAGSGVYSLWSSLDPGGLNSTSSDHSATVSTWRAAWSGGTGGDPFVITSSAGTASPRKWVLGIDAANFVGIEFTGTTIDAAGLGLNTLHLDLWTPDDASVLNVKVVDFGANGVWSGGDDVEGIATISTSSTPALATGRWLSYDLPLSSFSGLATTGHLAQMVLIAPNGGTVYLDNVYFWAATAPPTAPATAPAAPTAPAANVMSLLSATYSGTAGDYSSHVDSYHATCFGPPGASVSDYAIPSAHTVKKYSIGANGFGIIELIGATGGTATPPDSALCGGGTQTGLGEIDVSGMTAVHFDVWSPGGSTNFLVHLVAADSTGFIAGPGAPGGSTPGTDIGSPGGALAAGAWVSFDFAFSQFGPPTSPSALNRLALVKFFTETAGEFYVDNVYFYHP